MNCPECNHDDSFVTDSRSARDYIRRRRNCKKCGHKFTTNEFHVDLADQLKTSEKGVLVDYDKAVTEKAKKMIEQVLEHLTKL